MAELTRRTWLGSAAIGVAAAGIATDAARAADRQPEPLFGKVEGANVSLPPLHLPDEAQDAFPNPDPIARRLGVAVVGLGHLSLAQILPGFGHAKHVRVTALVSGEPEKARAVAAQYGVPARGIYDYAGFDGLRDNEDVDIVYIVLPNAMHAEYVERAARAGKHVLCEKPMATNVADAERMVAACRDAKRLLMIAYRCQYEPHNRALTSLVRTGALGRVRLIEAVNGQADAGNGQWRQNLAMAGGGSLPDVGLYCLNAARYLTGEEPVELQAQVTRPKGDRRFAEVEDICTFTLGFPSGIVATCASGYSFHEDRQLRVMGEKAWAGLDPAFSYDNIRLQISRKEGGTASLEQRAFPSRNQFALEMDHFAECVRAGRTPRTPGEEGLADQRLIAALYQSAAGGGIIRLPPASGLDVTRGPEPKPDQMPTEV